MGEGKKQRPWMPDQAGHDNKMQILFSGAFGRGCAPVPKTLFGGEDCLSEASSAAQANGTGAKAPEGPRPGANGFGSFCRNKRACPEPVEGTSLCGGETPHKKQTLDPRQKLSRMTDGGKEKNKDPGCPIKPGMTRGEKADPSQVLRFAQDKLRMTGKPVRTASPSAFPGGCV